MNWTTNSTPRKPPFLADFDEPVGEFRDAAIYAEERRRKVIAITAHARAQGLDANEEMVARHFAWFDRYYTGVIAAGYLMNRTGVRRITLDENW